MSDKEKEPNAREDVSERTVVSSIKKVQKPEEEKAYILFISGPLMGKMYFLKDQVTVIGRAEDCNIAITDPRVSRRHLQISLIEGKAVIEDLGSTNGTFLNGERLERTAVLKNSDLIHISSDTLFNFATGSEAERLFHEAMHQMANYDAVTGINNKHVFSRRFKEEFSYAKRSGSPLSLLMIDIDFFKKVNDTYGHMAGDYVLQGVAKRMGKALRDEDILARYGGEEFVVILRNTDGPGAIQLAERIRSIVAAEPFIFEQNRIPVTVSVGVASLPNDNAATAEELIAISDACLYRSKEEGRNKVTA